MRLKENQQEFMQYLIKKKLQSHSKNKINKWEENGHVLKQKQKMIPILQMQKNLMGKTRLCKEKL